MISKKLKNAARRSKAHRSKAHRSKAQRSKVRRSKARTRKARRSKAHRSKVRRSKAHRSKARRKRLYGGGHGNDDDDDGSSDGNDDDDGSSDGNDDENDGNDGNGGSSYSTGIFFDGVYINFRGIRSAVPDHLLNTEKFFHSKVKRIPLKRDDIIDFLKSKIDMAESKQHKIHVRSKFDTAVDTLGNKGNFNANKGNFNCIKVDANFTLVCSMEVVYKTFVDILFDRRNRRVTTPPIFVKNSIFYLRRINPTDNKFEYQIYDYRTLFDNVDHAEHAANSSFQIYIEPEFTFHTALEMCNQIDMWSVGEELKEHQKNLVVSKIEPIVYVFNPAIINNKNSITKYSKNHTYTEGSEDGAKINLINVLVSEMISLTQDHDNPYNILRDSFTNKNNVIVQNPEIKLSISPKTR